MFFDIGERPIDGPAYAGAAHTLGDELLKPSVIYAPAILALLRDVDVHAVAHITGGGIPGNLDRVLPAKAGTVVERRSWEVPAGVRRIHASATSATTRWRRSSTSVSG